MILYNDKFTPFLNKHIVTAKVPFHMKVCTLVYAVVHAVILNRKALKKRYT